MREISIPVSRELFSNVVQIIRLERYYSYPSIDERLCHQSGEGKKMSENEKLSISYPTRGTCGYTGLTNAGKCRLYRKKNSQSYNGKDSFRKKVWRKNLKAKPEEYNEHKKHDRFRKEYAKTMKSFDSISSSTNQTLPSSSSFVEPPSSCSSPQSDYTNITEPGSAEPMSAFSSKQIKRRSLIKAARNLPQSPRRKAEVLQGLVKKYEIRIQFKENRGRPRKDLSDEQQQWLTTFLERSDITYMNPGRKDCVYLGKVDGDIKYEQRRYLLWTLHDLLEIINGNSFIENEESFITWNNGTPMTFAQLYDFVKGNKAYSFNKSIPHAKLLMRSMRKSCTPR